MIQYSEAFVKSTNQIFSDKDLIDTKISSKSNHSKDNFVFFDFQAITLNMGNRKRKRNSEILDGTMNDSGIGMRENPPQVTPPPVVPNQNDQENEMEENEIEEIENEQKKFIKRLSKAHWPDELKRLLCTICFKGDFKSFDALIKHSQVI